MIRKQFIPNLARISSPARNVRPGLIETICLLSAKVGECTIRFSLSKTRKSNRWSGSGGTETAPRKETLTMLQRRGKDRTMTYRHVRHNISNRRGYAELQGVCSRVEVGAWLI